MEKKVEELSVVELKSVAYDQLAQIELAQNNLRAINQELAKRLQAERQGNQPTPQYDPKWQGQQPS